jgi:hypothetical protein
MWTKADMLSLQLAIVWLMVAGVAAAQNTPQPETANVEASPCYHKELEDLAFLEGNWTVALSTRLGDGQWEDTSATSEIKRDLRGCLLSERLAGSRQKRPFHVLSLFAFDNHSKLLQQVLTDSEHGLLALYQGRRNQEELVFDLPLIRDDGTKWIVRRAYFAVTPNSFSVENRHSQDEGKTWRVVVKARYVLKK